MKFVAVYRGEQVPIAVVKRNGQYQVTLKDKTLTVDAIRPNPQSLSLLVDGISYEVGFEKRETHYSVYFYNDTIEMELYEARKFRAAEVVKKTVHAGPIKVIAPMPGKLLKVLVQPDAQVSEGDPLVVIEAMKMQNELKSPKAGTVKQIQVKEGSAVSAQQVLMVID